MTLPGPRAVPDARLGGHSDSAAYRRSRRFASRRVASTTRTTGVCGFAARSLCRRPQDRAPLPLPRPGEPALLREPRELRLELLEAGHRGVPLGAPDGRHADPPASPLDLRLETVDRPRVHAARGLRRLSIPPQTGQHGTGSWRRRYGEPTRRPFPYA